MSIARAHGLAGTFSSLYNRSFRWYWFHRLATEGALQLSTVAQGWLVYELTQSALALGWVGAGRAVATLLVAPWGGVLSDRYDKRAVLIWTRVGMAAVHLVLAALISLGRVEVWHVALSSLLNGAMNALMTGAQQSIVSDLVDEKTLMNAVSLNAVSIGVTGMVFPTVGGLLIEFAGADGAYYAATLVYLMAVATLFQIPQVPPDGEFDREPPLRSLAEGVRYTARDLVLQSMILVALARFLFSMSYSTFMPKFASEELGMDATGLGILLSAPGLGALLGSLSMATLRDYRYKGRLLIGTGLVMGALLVLYSQVRSVALLLVLLVLLGACGNILRVVNQTVLQTCCDARYRGRVMSLYGVAMGSGPITSVPMGALADVYGVPMVIAIQGVLLAAVFGWMGARRPVREA